MSTSPWRYIAQFPIRCLRSAHGCKQGHKCVGLALGRSCIPNLLLFVCLCLLWFLLLATLTAQESNRTPTSSSDQSGIHFKIANSANQMTADWDSGTRQLLQNHFSSEVTRHKGDPAEKVSEQPRPKGARKKIGLSILQNRDTRSLEQDLQAQLHNTLQTLELSERKRLSEFFPASVKLVGSVTGSSPSQFSSVTPDTKVPATGHPRQALASPYSFSFTAQEYQDPKPRSDRATTALTEDLPPKRDVESAYGILLESHPRRSFYDGQHAFMNGDYQLASEIIMESRYTKEAVNDPNYLNWLLKSLLAARRLELIPYYLKQYRLQRGVLRRSSDPRDGELYYLVGRYYFAIGDMRLAREIFIDYLNQFQGGYYLAQSYYWIARSLERDEYLEEARTVYLLVVSYYSHHVLNSLAEYKAGELSLYLFKKQAEDFLSSRGVDWTL